MTRAEAFLVQWSTLKEEMTKTLQFQVKQGGGIRFDELNKVFCTKTKRWATKVSTEGRWMEAVENAACRQEVLAALSQLSLEKLPVELESVAPALLAGAGGAVAGGVAGNLVGGMMGDALPFAPLPVIVGAAGVATVVFGAINGRTSRRNQERIENLVSGYLAQIDAAGEQIADVWRRYETDVR